MQDGYQFFGQRRLVTIFSASNYCNEFDNAGAMMCVSVDMICSFIIIKVRRASHGVRQIQTRLIAPTAPFADHSGRGLGCP